MLSNFPKVVRLAEEALLLAIMDWLAIALGNTSFLGYYCLVSWFLWKGSKGGILLVKGLNLLSSRLLGPLKVEETLIGLNRLG